MHLPSVFRIAPERVLNRPYSPLNLSLCYIYPSNGRSRPCSMLHECYMNVTFRFSSSHLRFLVTRCESVEAHFLTFHISFYPPYDFWTQKFYRTKFRFRNPIKQNYSHVMFLQSLFHISITAFIPIVVFIDRAMLMNKSRNHVIYASELRDFILKQTAQRLSSEETERLTQLIFSNNIQDKDRKCKHIAAVQKIIRDKDLMLAHRVCPKCGGRLVERQGKYANFLGCSNYPQCRFTIKLM